MAEQIPEVESVENTRCEYAALQSYHDTIVNSRFTIAGLYVAGIGFMANAVFSKDATVGGRAAGSALAAWLTVCLWVLEARSRAILASLANRAIEIENRVWGLVGESWYSGLHSRTYKVPPTEAEASASPAPQHPGPDRPRVAWAKAPVPKPLAWYVSHSWGFDLLYLGTGLFWLVTLVASLYAVFHPGSTSPSPAP